MAITRDHLKDLTEAGLASDIFKVDRAYALLRTTGQHAETINKQQNGNFGELFGALQSALTTEVLLAVARIYDRPSQQYPTRCLKGILNYLRNNKTELPTIREPHQLKLTLGGMNVPSEVSDLVDNDPSEFSVAFATFFEGVLDDPEMQDTLEKLKAMRDKSLAHNEVAYLLTGPTWESLEAMIHLAKGLVGVLGWAYLSTAYTINGEYVLTSDAERPSRALARLFDQLYGKLGSSAQ
jgi:AbiU2